MGVLIDLDNRLVHLEDGQTLQATNWFDDSGMECEPVEAVVVVCGPDAEGMWWSMDVWPDERSGTLH